MPNLNGMGPQGAGPMTGRGLGYCGQGVARGTGEGLGFRRGLGQRLGLGRMFAKRANWQAVGLTTDEEKEILEQEKIALEEELDAIKKEIKGSK